MRIIKNLKNRKFMKRIFKNDKLLNNQITCDNMELNNEIESNNIMEVNNEITNDKVDSRLPTLPLNENSIMNSNETKLINNEEIFFDYNNPISHIHNEGQCLCLFFLLILYYGSIIFTKIKKSFEA